MLNSLEPSQRYGRERIRCGETEEDNGRTISYTAVTFSPLAVA